MLLIFKGALIGLAATACMDAWALALRAATGQPLPNWGFVGRWFWGLRSGVVFHDDIAQAEPFELELAFGWFCHYAVGLIYGVIFALIVGAGWFADPGFAPAWIFAILTLGFGWFLLLPGMGLGWAAARTENPAKARILGLASHTVFGAGLWASALLIA